MQKAQTKIPIIGLIASVKELILDINLYNINDKTIIGNSSIYGILDSLNNLTSLPLSSVQHNL